jgi:hypothetical protein
LDLHGNRSPNRTCRTPRPARCGTGWRFVIEECHAPRVVAHMAEPADVEAAGPGRHSKSDGKWSAWCRRSRR